MAKELILMAEPRTVLGKQVKALRREGLVPGVVYGPAVEGTTQVSVNRRDLERFYHQHGHTTLFTLTWEGGSQQVFIQEVQVEPVRRAPLHVDFFAPNLKKELVSKVAVVLHNQSSHIEGVLQQLLSEVEVRALPAAMPHQIDADIAHLVSGHDALRAGDLQLPKGATLVTDADAVVASVIGAAGPSEDVEVAEEDEAVTTDEAGADSQPESADESPAE